MNRKGVCIIVEQWYEHHQCNLCLFVEWNWEAKMEELGVETNAFWWLKQEESEATLEKFNIELEHILGELIKTGGRSFKGCSGGGFRHRGSGPATSNVWSNGPASITDCSSLPFSGNFFPFTIFSITKLHGSTLWESPTLKLEKSGDETASKNDSTTGEPEAALLKVLLSAERLLDSVMLEFALTKGLSGWKWSLFNTLWSWFFASSLSL